ncbi:hypothetical protein M407DRAFT_233012 [Tulasnella calospora MUT 4182]|uniref:Electron transfer flavoprotein-ubiquinone oxidoreductase n=1 Tax=Tulasnella calospora MUT 4182 TaxID=1051891 RepID=A0A0C3Q133_9AGAM|nr:hypothetical protein M407DRAFT_233012 [Tulasnella calospora MUT 4182]
MQSGMSRYSRQYGRFRAVDERSQSDDEGRPCTRSFTVSSGRRNDSQQPAFDPSRVDRPTDDVDVCIVGAEKGKEIRLLVLEKGSEVGSHTLSGAVIEPRALNELLPEWLNDPSHPLKQPAVDSHRRSTRSFPMPHPPQISNEGNYIVSLSQDSLAYTENGKAAKGVITNDSQEFQTKKGFEPGMLFRAKVSLLAEGAHGSLTKCAIKKYNLREGKDPQRRVRDEVYRPGHILHTIEYPLNYKTYAGGWVYHMADGLVSIGLVSTDRLFCWIRQRPKIKGSHNAMKSGTVAAEAAHNAIASLPEDSVNEDGEYVGQSVYLSNYEENMKQSWFRKDFNTPLGIWGGMAYSGVDSLSLKGRVPWKFHNRISDADHTQPAKNFKLIEYPPFEPPLSTDLLTSLALTNTNHEEQTPVHLQLPYAPLGDTPETREARRQHVEKNVGEFAGLLGRACPDGVYEYVDQEEGEGEKGMEDEGWAGKKLVINSQNCIDCKLCDIKVPTQDITGPMSILREV